MNEPLHRQETIFAQTCALPMEERAAYLAQACADDGRLRRTLGELLKAGSEAGDFLDGPPAALAPELTHRPPPPEHYGERIGRYRLIEKLGEGGAGVVYEAEQEEPVRRRVALKLMKASPDPAATITRFAAERQALAWMEHPNIARVFDAGTTDDGRLFFVMELVRGARLTTYCDENRLSLAERIALLVPVCRAIHHAHGKGVVHRDLKPGNILIAVHDGAPVPKVIDFGIAKVITPPDSPCADATPLTPTHALLGTPNYLSPEQADPGTRSVDARSDVYSLGVVLHELLTGHTPFAAHSGSHVGLEELRRRIRVDEPPRPSRHLAELSTDALYQRALQCQTSPQQLLRDIRGPLDTITTHCLETNPARRYPTAAALAADLDRYLQEQADPGPADTLLRSMLQLVQRRRTRPARAHPARVPTNNQSAYAAYLRGRRLATRSFNREDATRAVAEFEEATTLDPGFALAWAHLSMAQGAMYWFTYLDPTTGRLARCKAAADEALRLQPDLPEAHLTLGVYHYRGFRDWESAQHELEIARQSLPDDAVVRTYLGLNERRMGRWAESTAHLEEAVALDPRNTTAWNGLIDNHAFHRRHHEALAACARALAVAPDDRMVRRTQVWSRFALDGDRAALFAGLATAFAAPPDDARDRAELALLRGDFGAAARVLENSPAQSFCDHRRETAKAELQALTAHLRGDSAAARHYAAAAAGYYGASILHREPEEVFNLISLGRALALQGRGSEALDYGRRAMARLPVTRDALWGPEIIAEHAMLCLLAGATDEALTQLASLVRQPCDISAQELRVHPLWRRLGGDPRFETMLESITPLPVAG